MSAINPFHSREVDESEQRPASDVFRSSVASSESAINSRFASSGKFTTEQLEAGDDVGTPSNEPEFDPDDKRSLYERLQAQRDAKQEEFEHRNTFKNQMCAGALLDLLASCYRGAHTRACSPQGPLAAG